MNERNGTRVKGNAPILLPSSRSVLHIPFDRMACRGKLRSDLVESPAFRNDGQRRVPITGHQCTDMQHGIPLNAGGIRDPGFPMDRVMLQGMFQQAFTCQNTFYNGPVQLGNDTITELCGKSGSSLGRTTEQHDTAYRPVQSMNKAKVWSIQLPLQRGDQVGITRGIRLNWHAGWLKDRHDCII